MYDHIDGKQMKFWRHHLYVNEKKKWKWRKHDILKTSFLFYERKDLEIQVGLYWWKADEILWASIVYWKKRFENEDDIANLYN